MHRRMFKWLVVGLVLAALLVALFGGHGSRREQAAWFDGYRAGQLAQDGVVPPVAPGYGYAGGYGYYGPRLGFGGSLLRVIGFLVLGILAIKALFFVSAMVMGRRLAHEGPDGASFHAHHRAHWDEWRRMAKKHWRWLDEDEPESEPESGNGDEVAEE